MNTDSELEFREIFFYTPILACAFGMVIWGCLVLRSDPK
jgi:hypothetical protein